VSTEQMFVEINGETLLLDCAGAAWWPAERTLIIADIHFEKGSSYAKRGTLLPPYDTRTTLNRIEALMLAYVPARVVALGDSFHDGEGAARLDDDDKDMLAGQVSRTDWIWIEGNHDPHPPGWLGGTVTGELAVGGLVFRHEPARQSQAGEIAGHLHPCATVTRHGRSLRRRCFASDAARMVLPAFGAYAGGLDVDDDAIAGLFSADFAAYMLGGRRVYAVAARGLPQVVRGKTTDDSQPRIPAMRTAESP
jgi:DNA ligase-associated metallophosphoesterase